MPAPEIDYVIHLSEDGLSVVATISGKIIVTNALDLERDTAKVCSTHGVIDVTNGVNVSSTLEDS